MSQQLIGVQRRMMELGRIRLGDKGDKGQPQKLSKFRLTSASRALLEAAAELYGGSVRDWVGAPDEGYFELYTETDTLDIILPPVFSDRDGSPTLPYSQAYELWSGGGCQRRCDGETETLSAKPCLCDPVERTCKITTRLNVMLPKVPGLGVWRLESHGWNAASILPGTLDLLLMAAAEHTFIPAMLRLEQRTSKQEGTTRRFVVPVIDLPSIRLEELAGAAGLPGLNAPSVAPPRPALPAARAPIAEAFDHAEPAFGAPPSLPIAEKPELLTEPQAAKLNVLVGTLRNAGHITTESLWKAMRPEDEGNWPRDIDGGLHWSDLRPLLSKAEASTLIERLARLEERVAVGDAA